ncbi:conserved Plasmodium protein, unknown function [Plasmodium relictum]|uniref:Uncharacterized protein n=1 Tax=Plasmodium relictum TaxID=85471 RepID=A0A1J1H459_PLARL|nr:conserved Plasmodium protein, unknown function [Plasmodium relictum]CRG99521.1 conserved Plasmodium protein, unknown function [Plasmodium relictum]
MENNQKSMTNEDLLNRENNVKSLDESEEYKHNLKNELNSSSEFEFNFKKHIIDNFEEKNRGLFKLSLGNRVDSKSNLINENIIYNTYIKKYSKNDNISNDIVQSEFLVEDKKEVHENKNEIITKLKKEINLLTNKLEEKSDKIENVQKDNFQLEQIYKNKYYTDIKKEKRKVVDIRSKNYELIRKLNYYSASFHQLKQKIRCLLKNILALTQHIDANENFKFLLKNMKDISVILESNKYKTSEENKYKLKEKSERLKIHSLKNIKNENKKKEKNNSMKKSYHNINSLYSNRKFTSNCKCTTEKKKKLENIFINKENDILRNNSFLICCKKTHNRKKSPYNYPIEKKYSFKHYYNLRKISSINSKKKNNLINLSVHMKKIPPENSDNILNLFRETRKINHLLRNSVYIENYKKTNSQKRNINNASYEKCGIKRNETRKYTIQNKNNYSIKKERII